MTVGRLLVLNPTASVICCACAVSGLLHLKMFWAVAFSELDIPYPHLSSGYILGCIEMFFELSRLNFELVRFEL